MGGAIATDPDEPGDSTAAIALRAGWTAAVDPVVAPGPLAVPLLGSLQDAVAKLALPLETAEIAAVVADAGVSGLDARVAVVAVRGEQRCQLRAAHAIGLSGAARRQVLAVVADEAGFIAKVRRSRRSVFLQSGADAELRSQHDVPPPLAAGALAALPIVHEGTGFGVIVFGWSHRRGFSDDDRAFLHLLSALCGLALDRHFLSVEVVRLAAPLRGSEPTRHADAGAPLRVGDMHIDVVGNRIVIGERSVSVTPTELALLVFLADAPGRARSRREILRHIWHTEHVGDERVCDAHVSNLRHKIERDPARPERVMTQRGIGYSLRVHQPA